jgi:hypothetical protein
MGMQPFFALPLMFLIVFVFAGSIVVVSLNNRFRVRDLEHKETLVALEKGVDLPARQTEPWTPRIYLLRGMVWLFVGLTSFLALSAIAITSRRQIPLESRLAAVNDARLRGATPAEVEMLLHAQREEVGMPIGVAFLGLIPIGVGLAYLIFYRAESKKLLS